MRCEFLLPSLGKVQASRNLVPITPRNFPFSKYTPEPFSHSWPLKRDPMYLPPFSTNDRPFVHGTAYEGTDFPPRTALSSLFPPAPRSFCEVTLFPFLSQYLKRIKRRLTSPYQTYLRPLSFWCSVSTCFQRGRKPFLREWMNLPYLEVPFQDVGIQRRSFLSPR